MTDNVLKLPRDIYVAFWRHSIERYRQDARIFKANGDRQRRCYTAICRKRAGQALRLHGARFVQTEEEAEPCTS
jgi:hypothetical protein